ncbi:MAG: NADH-quinone oxidoreductase subunit NuoE [Deltaproteobacteria bacterium]|nr:NADH-quinone oxidoreductase subunit NuoE [Deltaproteobacteria bacterium]
MGVRQTMVTDELLKEFSEEQLRQVDAIIEKYQGEPGSLIPVLEEVQGALGYLPHEIQHRIAEGLNLPPSQIFGVVTFYSFFTMVPRGRHTIRVCLGTACYVRGGKKNLDRLVRDLGIEAGQTTEDRRFSLETIRCLGACGLAPVIVVDEDTHKQVKERKVRGMLERYE